MIRKLRMVAAAFAESFGGIAVGTARVHRTVLMGVATALLLPVSTIVLLGATTGTASASPVYSSSPTTCALGLSINWPAPGLSTNGNLTTSSTSSVTISNESSSCGTAPTLPPIVNKNTKCTPTSTPISCPSTQKGYYIENSLSGFATFGATDSLLKYVKKGLTSLTAGGITDTLKATAAGVTPSGALSCPTNPNSGGGTEEGFWIQGVVKASTAGKPYKNQPFQAVICLGGDTGTNTTGNFNKDLGSSAVITSASADASASYITIATPWPSLPPAVNGQTTECSKLKVSSSAAEASDCHWADGSAFPPSVTKFWKKFTGSTSALAAGGTLTATTGGTFTISAPAVGTGTHCPASKKLTGDVTATGSVTAVSGANVPA